MKKNNPKPLPTSLKKPFFADIEEIQISKAEMLKRRIKESIIEVKHLTIKADVLKSKAKNKEDIITEIHEEQKDMNLIIFLNNVKNSIKDIAKRFINDNRDIK